MLRLVNAFVGTVLVALLAVGATGQAATATSTPAATAVPSPVPAITVTWPTVKQVPAGLEITDDRDRSLAEVTANFTDPVAARRQFITWHWQRNHVLAFHSPAGKFRDPGKIDGIYISVHVFGGPEAAAEALDFAFDAQSTGTRLKEIPANALGDRSRSLYGKLSYGNEVTIYVQRGNLLIRLSASSPTGDPREQANELMTILLSS